MGLPRTTLGIIGFMLFVGWLIAMMFTPSDSTLHDTNENIKNTQTALADSARNTAQNLSDAANGNGNPFSNAYGSITGLFQVALNLIFLIANFLLVIFASFAAVVSTIILLPVEISEILIALLSIGLIFSLLSKVIET